MIIQYFLNKRCIPNYHTLNWKDLFREKERSYYNIYNKNIIQVFFKTSKFKYLSESHSYISEFLKLLSSTSKISWNTVLNIYSLFAIKCVIVLLLWRSVNQSRTLLKTTMHRRTYWTPGEWYGKEKTQHLTSRRRWWRKDQHKSYRKAIASHFLYFTLEKMKGTRSTDYSDTAYFNFPEKRRVGRRTKK